MEDDRETKALRIKCHDIFDRRWMGRGNFARSLAYAKVALDLGIPVEKCHFKLMDKDVLEKVHDYLQNKYEPDGGFPTMKERNEN